MVLLPIRPVVQDVAQIPRTERLCLFIALEPSFVSTRSRHVHQTSRCTADVHVAVHICPSISRLTRAQLIRRRSRKSIDTEHSWWSRLPILRHIPWRAIARSGIQRGAWPRREYANERRTARYVLQHSRVALAVPSRRGRTAMGEWFPNAGPKASSATCRRLQDALEVSYGRTISACMRA